MWRTWREAMSEALYGPNGFYTLSGAPGANFRTAAHASPMWADAIAELVMRVDHRLDSPATMTVLDLGAGGGEMSAGLRDRLPDRIEIVAVDLAPRPADLEPRIRWHATIPGPVAGLLFANEWLDVVPLNVVELTNDGPRLVEVGDDGEERLSHLPPTAEELQWLERWWPLAEVGDRAEVGITRDNAWSQATDQLSRGLAVAVDYAAIPDRDLVGTLTGYRAGNQCAPIPDGSCDITAHVLFESLTRAGDVVLTQREALQRLGLASAVPSYDGENVPHYLHALNAAGEAAELLDSYGLGGFTWLLRPVGIKVPV